MKSNQKYLTQIEAYIKGTLSEEEMAQVQNRILEDPDFAQLVNSVKHIRDSAILSKKKSLLQELKKLEEDQR